MKDDSKISDDTSKYSAFKSKLSAQDLLGLMPILHQIGRQRDLQFHLSNPGLNRMILQMIP